MKLTDVITNAAMLRKFMRKIEITKRTQCWLWTGGKDGAGYGCLYFNGLTERVHRIAFVLWKANIPKHLLVRHTCDVPNCVNPSHLVLGTIKDNANDSVVRGRAPKGSKKVNAKLNEADVRRIKRALEMGETQQSIADRYGITRQLVSAIKTGLNWTHVR